MSVKVGTEAPDFEAAAYKSGDLTSVKLSDYRGKWVVLVFYPGDFTFVCPTELVALAGHYNDLSKTDVEVLAISIDTHFVHKVWDDRELSKMIGSPIPYPMLYDKAAEIGKKYGVYDKKAGEDMRGTFIIDPDGIIQCSEVHANAIGRNMDELKRKVQACQYARESGGTEACPSTWTPGGATLKPGVDLIGKVWEQK